MLVNNLYMKKIKNSKFVNVEKIGSSELGKSLNVKYVGNKNASLRIFIIAGQHGDEKYSRLAVTRLIKNLNRKQDLKPLTFYAVLTDANPDGGSKKRRRNALEIDLNRDHQLLESKEVRAIHSFVRSWKPHAIIDVHNFRARRKHLIAKNLIVYYDVFMDIPTNPSIPQLLDNKKLNQFFIKVKSDLQSHEITCERYTMIKRSGRVRHSTLDIKDARNSLALRYGVLTILLEGRQPTKENGEEKKRLILAQYRALRSIIKWIKKHRNDFLENQKHIPIQDELIAIGSKYQSSNHALQMIFKNLKTKKPNVVTLSNYSPKVEITRFINLPNYYAVPLDRTVLIDTLKQHGFSFKRSNFSKTKKIEYYTLRSINHQGIMTRRMKRRTILKKAKKMKLDNYAIFPTNQQGGRCLAVFLEPKSMYGLHRYPKVNLSFSDNSEYPVLRILK